MSTYRVDSSCYIESQLQRKGEFLFRNSDGSYLDDEAFINQFFAVKNAISESNHNNLEERVRKLDDINAVFKFVGGGDNYTLLHKAVEKGCHVCVQMLLQNGAKSDIINHEGKTAEMMARAKMDPQMIDLIEKSKPVSKTISIKTVECTLSKKSETQIMQGMGGFPETWSQMFEGKLFFGPDFQDRATVILSRSVNAQSYDYELKVPFKVTEMEYEGKKAYKIDYDEKLFVVITPSDKYLIGKNHLYIRREETLQKKPDDNCIVS